MKEIVRKPCSGVVNLQHRNTCNDIKKEDEPNVFAPNSCDLHHNCELWIEPSDVGFYIVFLKPQFKGSTRQLQTCYITV